MNINAINPQTSSAISDSVSDIVEVQARKPALDEVASQFEAVFMSILLEEMRNTCEDGLFSGEGSDTLGAMFDVHMGEHLAQNSNLGIRSLLMARYAANQTASNDLEKLRDASMSPQSFLPPSTSLDD